MNNHYSACARVCAWLTKTRTRGGRSKEREETWRKCAVNTVVTCFTMGDGKPSGILPLSSYAQKRKNKKLRYIVRVYYIHKGKKENALKVTCEALLEFKDTTRSTKDAQEDACGLWCARGKARREVHRWRSPAEYIDVTLIGREMYIHWSNWKLSVQHASSLLSGR